MRAIVLGLLASFFFAFTFILNRSMQLGGGSWAWSASLRFLFMLPMLVVMVAMRGGLRASLVHLSQHWSRYFLWSTIGFGIFYASVCLSSAYGEAWLVAATWQIVIITGSLLAPFLPSIPQIEQSLLVSLFSGVVATLLFFTATHMARQEGSQLAAVEATQSGEVLFTLLGEIILLKAMWPSPLSLSGIALVIAGMVFHSVEPLLLRQPLSNDAL